MLNYCVYGRDRYREVLWISAEDELAVMSEMVASFDSRCRKMPRKLREWEAFQVILFFLSAVPLLLAVVFIY